MNRRWQNTICGGLGLAMLLTGCASNAVTSQTSGSTTAAAGVSSSASAAQDTDASGSTQTNAVPEETYEISIMGNLKTEMEEEDTAYIKGLEDALNLKINIELPPSTSYQERLQMMLASGEYPDATLFISTTDKMFVDAVKNGVFIPLNPYLESAENLQAYTYDISWETLKILGDDNIYGIPRTSIARADGFLIRQDWLDNLGIDFTEGENITLDQLEDIMRAFTTQDPDGNGENDTYGLGSNSDDLGNISVLVGPAFGLTGWKEYDGVYMDPMYSKDMDNFKQALEWSNKMWEEGLVDPDWPTVKTDVKFERFTKGITGIVDEFAGWMTDKENSGKELNPDYKLSYITGVVAKEGDTYTSATSSTGFWGQWCISNTAKDPQRIVDLFDYMLSDEYWDNTKYGYEGVTYTVSDDGSYQITDAYDNAGIGRQIVRRNDDPSFFVSLAQDEANRDRVNNLIDICIKQYEFPLDQGYRPAISDDPTFIDYQKNMKVQISKIIVGDLPVSDWDDILDGWYEAGGETYIKQMQDYIASQQNK